MDTRVLDFSVDGRVFVIDDDPAVRDSLRILFELRGLHTECFDSVAAFRARGVDIDAGCLIVDLHMPAVDGLELIEALAAEGSPLRMIMLSGAFNDGFRARAMAAGAVACIDKPYEPSQLVKAVQAVLRAGGKGAL
jgi:two-component system, LuxR family, response regulator FixJ